MGASVDEAAARKERVLAYMQQQAAEQLAEDSYEWESDDIATHMPSGGPTSHILPEEREMASFHIAGLKEIVSGTKRQQNVEEFKHIFDENPIFESGMDDFLSYPELAEKQIVRAAEAIRTVRENPKFMAAHMAQQVSMADMFNTGGLGIHFVAYLPFLESQANEEQLAKWRSGARMFSYMGAYAQTELGHGSNVRALETTATFDKETDEFVINSPTLTSMKWWPTGMYAATHGVVFAQLIIDGTSHGVFGFFMQFRDEHGNLMPGVEIGEIGPKLGQGETNIGYGRFDHVRIPRFNFMNKLVTITREGEFIAPPPKLSKFKYIGMMNIRVGMVGGAGRSAGQAATIAIRYSCIRRQGFKDSKSSEAVTVENCIMDYKMQQCAPLKTLHKTFSVDVLVGSQTDQNDSSQGFRVTAVKMWSRYRLFKALGASYLMLWTGRNIQQFLRKVMEGVAAGDAEADKAADELPELHATCAGLKAFCTSWSANMIEDCRKCCGGQGFLRSSGIADLSSSYVSNVTAEGEAMILALQTARYLIKTVNEARSQPESIAGSVTYITDEPLDIHNVDLDDPSTRSAALVALLKDRARNVAHDLAEDFNTATAAGASFDEALNSVAVQGWHATECHCMYYMAMQALDAIPANIADPNAQAAVMNLVDLVMLQAIKDDGGSFGLERKQLRHVSHLVNEALDTVRPDAVALSDALGFADHNLKSTLGRYDGNVYEAIYEEARKSPLNGKHMVGWEKFSEVLDLDFIKDKQGQRHVPQAKL